ncbi:MAG TPA: hypothetical protein VKB49_20565 [Candidatus Sulfotelmatobacter sp.]|nr:hypothetical protein [Candidatus Sulfotelmatobacter sp.]
MSRTSEYSRLLKSIAFTMLVAGLAAGQAPAGAKRPAAVPADFVITPFGYFHPSCVSHLAKGDVLLQDEAVIQHANGTSENIEECAYPHFESDGTKVVGDVKPAGDEKSQPPYIGHSWVEYASIHDSANYGQIYSEWDVPPTPKSDDGQILYFFNGLEQYSGDVTIIQPVLGWNADFSSAWGIAAWNCCKKGTVQEATPARVNPGDHLEGYVFNNCSAGTTKCGSWDIVIVDQENGNFSQLIKTSNFGQTFNWAFGAVLEVYYISKCADYPAAEESGYSGGLSFYNESVLNDNFVSITPAWTVSNVSGGLTPQCNYGGSLPKQVVLKF